MSPRQPEYEVVDAIEPAVVDEHTHDDGSKYLTQRELIHLLFIEPAIRNYVLAGFSALAMMFLILFRCVFRLLLPIRLPRRV